MTLLQISKANKASIARYSSSLPSIYKHCLYNDHDCFNRKRYREVETLLEAIPSPNNLSVAGIDCAIRINNEYDYAGTNHEWLEIYTSSKDGLMAILDWFKYTGSLDIEIVHTLPQL